MEIVFRSLSSWQKPDCINRSAEYDCPNAATQEAACHRGRVVAGVRCCAEQKCMDRAAELARVAVEALSG